MYMESLREEDGYYVLGGFDDVRMHAARYRLLHDHFYVPLDEFVDIQHGTAAKRPADRHALQPGGRPDPFPDLSTTTAATAMRWSPICRPSTPAATTTTRWPGSPAGATTISTGSTASFSKASRNPPPAERKVQPAASPKVAFRSAKAALVSRSERRLFTPAS